MSFPGFRYFFAKYTIALTLIIIQYFILPKW